MKGPYLGQASGRRRWIAGGIGLAVSACSPLQTRLAPAKLGHEVPLYLSDYGLAFADIRVQGRPVRALLDTGSASGLRLSSRLAQTLNVPLNAVPGALVRGLDARPHPVQRGQIASMELGSLALGPVDIEVTGSRIEGIVQQVGTVFDAVLGWGLLGQTNLELDYPGRRLRIGGDCVAAGSASVLRLPYAEVARLPVIEGTVAGQPVRLLVDTGAPLCNLDVDLAQAPVGAVVERMLVLGAWSDRVGWRVKDLSVIRQALGSAATLGNSLLSRYRLGFCVGERMLALH